MKDLRIGESLWEEWDGEYYEKSAPYHQVYFTIEHVDVNNEVVRKALVYAMQRDGVAISLAEGFRLIENCRESHLFSGVLDGESFAVCSSDGKTKYGDLLEEVKETTFIEF
jgi:hypothetical protein